MYNVQSSNSNYIAHAPTRNSKTKHKAVSCTQLPTVSYPVRLSTTAMATASCMCFTYPASPKQVCSLADA